MCSLGNLVGLHLGDEWCPAELATFLSVLEMIRIILWIVSYFEGFLGRFVSSRRGVNAPLLSAVKLLLGRWWLGAFRSGYENAKME